METKRDSFPTDLDFIVYFNMYRAGKNDQFGTITIVANKETLRVSNVAIDPNDSYRLYVFLWEHFINLFTSL